MIVSDNFFIFTLILNMVSNIIESLQAFVGLIFVIAFTAAKAVEQEDQTAEASQSSSKAVVQQRIDLFGHHDQHHDHVVVDHHHHHEDHDPGFWKKKLIWKEGWKKIWNPAKKQIWVQTNNLI